MKNFLPGKLIDKVYGFTEIQCLVWLKGNLEIKNKICKNTNTVLKSSQVVTRNKITLICL